MMSPADLPPGYPSGTAHLSDAAFLMALESCTLPAGAFRHYDHIRLAWIYLGRLPYLEATERMVESIRRFATHHGATTKYHDTMTRFWMHLVAHALATSSDRGDFASFAAANPPLFNKRRVFDFYSDEVLFGQSARSGWVEPDLMALPGDEARRPVVAAAP